MGPVPRKYVCPAGTPLTHVAVRRKRFLQHKHGENACEKFFDPICPVFFLKIIYSTSSIENSTGPRSRNVGVKSYRAILTPILPKIFKFAFIVTNVDKMGIIRTGMTSWSKNSITKNFENAPVNGEWAINTPWTYPDHQKNFRKTFLAPIWPVLFFKIIYSTSWSKNSITASLHFASEKSYRPTSEPNHTRQYPSPYVKIFIVRFLKNF